MSWLLMLMMYLWLSPNEVEHDAVIAVFNIYEEQDELMLHMIFDIEDYKESLGLEEDAVTTDQLEKYLLKTTKWQVNRTMATIKVLELIVDRDHYKARCSLSHTNGQIKDLTIHNEFLLNVEDHSNLIMIDVNKTNKDFRMHARRTDLKVSMDDN